MRSLLWIILAAGILLWSCDDDDNVDRMEVDGNTTPTMVTDSVNSFVSDSGITRYRIESPIWLMYDNADEPYWYFPQGIALEQFDDSMSVQAHVQSDTARYFSRLKLWKLDGNVRMRNINRDKFLTEQLFWNQNTHKVYSDSFVHIERGNRILEGYGFVSNENITSYTIRQPSGIIPTDEFEKRDSTKNTPTPQNAPTPAE